MGEDQEQTSIGHLSPYGDLQGTQSMSLPEHLAPPFPHMRTLRLREGKVLVPDDPASWGVSRDLDPAPSY